MQGKSGSLAALRKGKEHTLNANNLRQIKRQFERPLNEITVRPQET